MTNSEQPAFAPSSEYIRQLNNGYREQSGLTKRECFAAMAMQGLLASSSVDQKDNDREAAYAYAKASIMLADELLKQLEK